MPFEIDPPSAIIKVVTKDSVPPGGKPYRVRDKDSWHSLAARFHINVMELIKFNFNTTCPGMVNWFLHWKVGCVKPTKNGLNWMFSDDADPGIIHFPAKTQGLPPCNPGINI